MEEKLRKFAEFKKYRESSEIHILSAAPNENNIKNRYNLVNIKVFVKEKPRLQQWRPRKKAEFPMKMDVIRI